MILYLSHIVILHLNAGEYETLTECCAMHPYRWHSAVYTERHDVFSFTQSNETFEKETNPYFVIPFMCLAESPPFSGPNFLKVASLLTASTSSFLSSLQSGLHPTWWSYFVIAYNCTSNLASIKHLALVSIPSSWNHWFLVFLLLVWPPLLSFPKGLLFLCLLLRHYWPLGFGSYTACGLLYSQPEWIIYTDDPCWENILYGFFTFFYVLWSKALIVFCLKLSF